MSDYTWWVIIIIALVVGNYAGGEAGWLTFAGGILVTLYLKRSERIRNQELRMAELKGSDPEGRRSMNSIEGVEAAIDREMERRRKEESLTCPHCGYEFDLSDDFPRELITYWGEDGEMEIACQNCDQDFMAKEEVRRTFESRPKTDADD